MLAIWKIWLLSILPEAANWRSTISRHVYIETKIHRSPEGGSWSTQQFSNYFHFCWYDMFWSNQPLFLHHKKICREKLNHVNYMETGIFIQSAKSMYRLESKFLRLTLLVPLCALFFVRREKYFNLTNRRKMAVSTWFTCFHLRWGTFNQNPLRGKPMKNDVANCMTSSRSVSWSSTDEWRFSLHVFIKCHPEKTFSYKGFENNETTLVRYLTPTWFILVLIAGIIECRISV